MRNVWILFTAVMVSVSICSCAKRERHDARGLTALVSIEGSDTMTDLVQSWATNFMKKEPNVPISVNSGNSGGGIEALINRTTDLAAASRDLNSTELKELHDRAIKLKKVTVARDSIAIVVNPHNPVQSLTLSQAKAIFAGTITNWNEVGGDKLPIHVYTREESSGTYNFFKQHLLNNTPYAKGSNTMLSGADMIVALNKDKSSIGYIGMGGASNAGDKVQVMGLKLSEDSNPVLPSEESTLSDYPLSRPLILFMDEDPKPSVRKFVDYCLSKDAQQQVREQGYAPVAKNLP